MRKMFAVMFFVLAVSGTVFALDDDARFSGTGTADEVGLWCRGLNSSDTAYTMPAGLYFNCSSGEVTLGAGIGTTSVDDSAITSNKLGSGAVASSAKLASTAIVYTVHVGDENITSPKLASTAVTSGKVAGMNSGTASSGKVACWKDNGYGGYCGQLSSINSTGCDLCY